MNLNELKVKSFVIEDLEQKAETAKGGIGTPFPGSWLDRCPTFLPITCHLTRPPHCGSQQGPCPWD